MKAHDLDENVKLDLARMQALAGITKKESPNSDGHNSPLTTKRHSQRRVHEET